MSTVVLLLLLLLLLSEPMSTPAVPVAVCRRRMTPLPDLALVTERVVGVCLAVALDITVPLCALCALVCRLAVCECLRGHQLPICAFAHRAYLLKRRLQEKKGGNPQTTRQALRDVWWLAAVHISTVVHIGPCWPMLAHGRAFFTRSSLSLFSFMALLLGQRLTAPWSVMALTAKKDREHASTPLRASCWRRHGRHPLYFRSRALSGSSPTLGAMAGLPSVHGEHRVGRISHCVGWHNASFGLPRRRPRPTSPFPFLDVPILLACAGCSRRASSPTLCAHVLHPAGGPFCGVRSRALSVSFTVLGHIAHTAQYSRGVQAGPSQAF